MLLKLASENVNDTDRTTGNHTMEQQVVVNNPTCRRTEEVELSRGALGALPASFSWGFYQAGGGAAINSADPTGAEGRVGGGGCRQGGRLWPGLQCTTASSRWASARAGADRLPTRARRLAVLGLKRGGWIIAEPRLTKCPRAGARASAVEETGGLLGRATAGGLADAVAGRNEGTA